MQTVARVVFPITGTQFLWPEDWRATRAASKSIAGIQTNSAYDLAVARSMLNNLAKASEVRQVKDIADRALAQKDKQQLVMQYCFISARLASTLEATVASVFERLRLGRDPSEYNLFKSEWAMLQEAVARAMGLTVRGIAGRRLGGSSLRSRQEAQPITKLIRQRLELIRNADTQIAWQAIELGAGRVWSLNSDDEQ